MIPDIKSKPPGNRMLKKMRLETKSWLMMAAAFLLVSLGLYVFVNALQTKNEGSETFRWVLLGTYSLVLINLGLYCLAVSFRFRMLIEINKKNKKTEKKLKAKIKRLKEAKTKKASE
jgi:sulfite exporter TauE/SafE